LKILIGIIYNNNSEGFVWVFKTKDIHFWQDVGRTKLTLEDQENTGFLYICPHHDVAHSIAPRRYMNQRGDKNYTGNNLPFDPCLQLTKAVF